MSTRVTLRFDVVNSPRLSQEQRDLIMHRLRTQIGKDGALRVISQQTRSQAANRDLAVERFTELMREALRVVPVRKKVRVSRAAKERRLEEKKQRSISKSRRLGKIPIEEQANKTNKFSPPKAINSSSLSPYGDLFQVP